MDGFVAPLQAYVPCAITLNGNAILLSDDVLDPRSNSRRIFVCYRVRDYRRVCPLLSQDSMIQSVCFSSGEILIIIQSCRSDPARQHTVLVLGPTEQVNACFKRLQRNPKRAA